MLANRNRSTDVHPEAHQLARLHVHTTSPYSLVLISVSASLIHCSQSPSGCRKEGRNSSKDSSSILQQQTQACGHVLSLPLVLLRLVSLLHQKRMHFVPLLSKVK